MRAAGVEIAKRVLAQDMQKVALSKDDDVVKTLPPDATLALVTARASPVRKRRPRIENTRRISA